jgi:hypothetical protein
MLKNLLLGKLTNIIHSDTDDFEFENNYFVDFLCAAKTETMIAVYNGENKFAYSQIKKWHKYEDDDFTEFEKIENSHSRNCNQRWEKIIPSVATDDKFCQYCFYYFPIKGDFCFGDFGLCSNPKSSYDAKAVMKKSNCKNYSEDYNYD